SRGIITRKFRALNLYKCPMIYRLNLRLVDVPDSWPSAEPGPEDSEGSVGFKRLARESKQLPTEVRGSPDRETWKALKGVRSGFGREALRAFVDPHQAVIWRPGVLGALPKFMKFGLDVGEIPRIVKYARAAGRLMQGPAAAWYVKRRCEDAARIGTGELLNLGDWLTMQTRFRREVRPRTNRRRRSSDNVLSVSLTSWRSDRGFHQVKKLMAGQNDRDAQAIGAVISAAGLVNGTSSEHFSKAFSIFFCPENDGEKVST
ncbi:unnamed protein product, partial [marine sediment metagenome]